MERSCILRVAGAPIGLWLAAANPGLFAAMRELERRRSDYEALGRQLADAIGKELVGAEGIARGDRNLALEVRRRLYNGRPIEHEQSSRVIEIAVALGRDPQRFRGPLATAVGTSRAILELDQQIDRAVDGEEGRLAEVAWRLACELPMARVLLEHRNPTLLTELGQRVARGAAWGSKSARRSGEYLAKVLRRATTKSNPRDWHGHVGLLAIGGEGATLEPVGLDAAVAVQWIENAHRQRRELMQSPIATRADARLAVTPLHWRTDEHLRAWAVDREDPRKVNEVELRRTSLLDEIYDALAEGSVLHDDFVSAMSSGSVDPEVHGLLSGFAEHLARLGVLEVSSPPRERFVGPGECVAVAELVVEPSEAGHRKEAGFLDVYRSASGSLPRAVCRRLERQFGEVQRLLALIEVDRRGPSGGARTDESSPVPLLEAIEARVLAAPGAAADGEPPIDHHWPPARRESSGYGRLLSWIAGEADRSQVVDIDAQRLDALGAATGSFAWPVDCVLRVPDATAAYDAVLDEAFPAGSLDARFVGALRRVEGVVPHADGYQEFLRELEAVTDTTIVELLIPPLSVGAANAIRRPLLTRAWTGDPDVQLYIDGADAAALRYVPLGSITLRRCGGASVVEAGGRRLWPIYHATRLPLAPWSVLADVLLTASPLSTQWAPRRLHFSLDAFPERVSMPRITVGGGLVVSCAQWRVSAGELWERRACLRTKLREVEQLRGRLGLPRWVFASSGRKRKPMACDLESIASVRVLEDAAREGGPLFLAEMLPTPEELLVVDDACSAGSRSVSSMMLRFPYDEPPRAMARRIAAELRR